MELHQNPIPTSFISMPTPPSKSPDLDSYAPATPIGGYLVEAGLITPAQVSVVLNDQQMETNMLFGEVLVARGWVKLETIEFIMTRVVEPERRATHDRKLAEALTEVPTEAPTEILTEILKQTQPPQIPHYPVKFSADRSDKTPAFTPLHARRPTPQPYPTTPPVVARARSLDGNVEFEIFESLADTSSLDTSSLGGRSTINAYRNDRKSLPSVREDGGVNWAG